MVYYLCRVTALLYVIRLIYSNCAVIGHSTCQTATLLDQVGCIVTRPFSSPGGWGLGTRLIPWGGRGTQMGTIRVIFCNARMRNLSRAASRVVRRLYGRPGKYL